MSNLPTLCCLGSVNLDMIIQTEKLPVAGETVTGGRFSSLPGGKGANTAFAAQNLGAQVSLVGMVGQDAYATEALKGVKEAGVDLSLIVEHDNAPTGLAFINVSDDGENQIAVASGANMEFMPEHLPALTQDAMLTQFEIPVATIEAATKDFKGFVAVNASPVSDGIRRLFDRAGLIIVNEGEYAAYKDRLVTYHGLLAVTLGARGAVLRQNGKVLAEAAPPKVDVIDTTGAGDAFAAALTVALVKGQSPEEALRFACTVGALTTTKLGTQTAAPKRGEVDALLA
jgi:ribokinase